MSESLIIGLALLWALWMVKRTLAQQPARIRSIQKFAALDHGEPQQAVQPPCRGCTGCSQQEKQACGAPR